MKKVFDLGFQGEEGGGADGDGAAGGGGRWRVAKNGEVFGFFIFFQIKKNEVDILRKLKKNKKNEVVNLAPAGLFHF